MKKKTYFMDLKLKSGEWVTVLYESASRKGTFPHEQDVHNALWSNDIEYDSEYLNMAFRNMSAWTYILNEKNKDEQCFGDHRIIDLR